MGGIVRCADLEDLAAEANRLAEWIHELDADIFDTLREVQRLNDVGQGDTHLAWLEARLTGMREVAEDLMDRAADLEGDLSDLAYDEDDEEEDETDEADEAAATSG
jgi:hypothetical protein